MCLVPTVLLEYHYPQSQNSQIMIIHMYCHPYMHVCTYVCMYVLHIHMWLLCQNPPHTHTMANNSFHCQLIVTSNKLFTTTPLPRVLICFFDACFWGLSNVHECLGLHWIPLIGLYRQPLRRISQSDLLMIQAMELAIFCDILSTMGP